MTITPCMRCWYVCQVIRGSALTWSRVSSTPVAFGVRCGWSASPGCHRGNAGGLDLDRASPPSMRIRMVTACRGVTATGEIKKLSGGCLRPLAHR